MAYEGPRRRRPTAATALKTTRPRMRATGGSRSSTVLEIPGWRSAAGSTLARRALKILLRIRPRTLTWDSPRTARSTLRFRTTRRLALAAGMGRGWRIVWLLLLVLVTLFFFLTRESHRGVRESESD